VLSFQAGVAKGLKPAAALRELGTAVAASIPPRASRALTTSISAEPESAAVRRAVTAASSLVHSVN
jgi:hypothetical protein